MSIGRWANRGARRQVVASLGKLTGEAPREEAGWEELEALLDGQPAAARQLRLGQSPVPEGPRWEVVDVRDVTPGGGEGGGPVGEMTRFCFRHLTPPASARE